MSFSYLLNLTESIWVKIKSRKVRRAFRARAQLWHPDRGGDPEQFQALSQAYAQAMQENSLKIKRTSSVLSLFYSSLDFFYIYFVLFSSLLSRKLSVARRRLRPPRLFGAGRHAKQPRQALKAFGLLRGEADLGGFTKAAPRAKALSGHMRRSMLSLYIF